MPPLLHVPQLNTNDGFANALLGNVNSYSQYTGTTTFNVKYWNVELYVQDNWKVNRRLTLDIGMRFYHQTPQEDVNDTFVNFIPSTLFPVGHAADLRPGLFQRRRDLHQCRQWPGGARIPLTGATAASGFIGDFVPNSGDPTAGLVVLGSTACRWLHTISRRWPLRPRIGFAYDLFGDGKTAIRGGFGMFYNRLDGNQVYAMSGQAPTCLPGVGQQCDPGPNRGAKHGSPAQSVESEHRSQQSLHLAALQRSVGHGHERQPRHAAKLRPRTPWSVSAPAWDHSYNQHLTYNPNWIPIGTGWPFTPSNINPTTAGNTSADIGSIFERTTLPGVRRNEQFRFHGGQQSTTL